MQNLIVVSHTMCINVGGPNILQEDGGPCPLGVDRGWCPRNVLLPMCYHTKFCCSRSNHFGMVWVPIILLHIGVHLPWDGHDCPPRNATAHMYY